MTPNMMPLNDYNDALPYCPMMYSANTFPFQMQQPTEALPLNSSNGCQNCPMMIHEVPNYIDPLSYGMTPNNLGMDSIYTNMLPPMLPQMMADIDEEDDIEDMADYEYTDIEQRSSKKDIDEILKTLETNNPDIFGTFHLYNIPYPIAKSLVRKIIQVSHLNSKSN
jgi:hypothetical protein